MLNPSTINQPNDPFCNPTPSDTIQSLKWAPLPQNFLCAGGWDGKASIWEISPDGQNLAKSQITLPNPILSVCWKPDGSSIFLGTGDTQVLSWDLATQQMTPIGHHASTVREVIWCDPLGMLISGSWDSSIAFWDGRQPNPVAQISVPGRVFGMAMSYPLLIAILSDKKLAVWNLERVKTGVTVPEIVSDPTMKFQIRSISTSVDCKSIALGHLEGRCSLKKVQLEPTIRVENDFMFKCHRDSLAHSLNAVCFNNLYSTFATGATDASIIFWDKNVKQKVRTFTGLGGPVTAMDFKADSSLFAYALGNDWHKGIEGSGLIPTKICYRPALEDAKPKGPVGNSFRGY